MPLTLSSCDWKNPDRSSKQKISCSTQKYRLWGVYMKQCAKATAFLLLTLSLLSVRAQETTGTIAGNVTDATGAVVVGATVKVTNTLTNTVRSTVTDSAGQYTIPALPAGNYSIDVDKTGFQGQRTNSIVLDASQTARQDFKITVGQVNETVTIQAGAAAALLQTETASVGEVIDGKKIVDLPLNGRDFIQLAQLIPGANAGVANSITARRARGSIATSDATYGTTALQVNGARDTQNRFSIDGIESMDYDGFTYNFSPSIDAIAEFRVDTSTSGTQVGAAAGADVNQIIKSGTNSLHGTLWEFNRNNEFTQSYDALAHVAVKPARLNQNQFGGNVGGPVYIPHLYNGHNKTFFFFNAETGYQLNGVLQASTTVPSAAVRSGDIDELINAANAASSSRPLINPYTGKPFVLGQKITVAPQSLVMLSPSITPLPNITPAPGTTNNYDYPLTKTKNYQHDYIGRGDQTIGTKDTISGHYIFDVTYSNGPATWGNNNDNNDATSKHFVIAETHVFSPSLVNEFRYGWSNFVEIELFGTSNNSAFNIASGMMQIPFSSSNPRYYGPPNITISNVGATYTLFNLQRTIGPRNRSNGINQFVDNFSFAARTPLHQVKPGCRQTRGLLQSRPRPAGNLHLRWPLYRALYYGRPRRRPAGFPARLHRNGQHQSYPDQRRDLFLDSGLLGAGQLEYNPHSDAQPRPALGPLRAVGGGE